MSKWANMWLRIKHWIDVIIFFLIGVLYLRVWAPYLGVQTIPQRDLWNQVTSLTKDTIQTGIIATSILLPTSIGILGFIYTRIQTRSGTTKDLLKDVRICFLHACVAFLASLGMGVFNAVRLPFELTCYTNITRNPTVFLLVLCQFASLFLGILKMCRGAFYITKWSS